MSRLRFGPLDATMLVVCIDMQRLFLEPGDWYCPDGLAILPAVRALVSARPDRSLFTRFIPVETPDRATGSWQRFYRRWRNVTLAESGAEKVELHAELSSLAGPASIFDKGTYDAFDGAGFAAAVEARAPGAIIFCGIETDVCVLASALSAVDLGYRVIIACDAVASAELSAHRACLEHVYPRYDQQIELVDTAALIKGWAVS